MWWWTLFLIGLVLDSIEGGRLGQTSFILLIAGLIIVIVKKWLPKRARAVKLKL